MKAETLIDIVVLIVGWHGGAPTLKLSVFAVDRNNVESLCDFKADPNNHQK